MVTKLCKKPPQQTKVPLAMGNLFSERRKVAIVCNSCIKKKNLYMDRSVYRIHGANTQVRLSVRRMVCIIMHSNFHLQYIFC